MHDLVFSPQYHFTSSSHPSIVPVSISNSVSFRFLVSWQLVWNGRKLPVFTAQPRGKSRIINIINCGVSCDTRHFNPKQTLVLQIHKYSVSLQDIKQYHSDSHTGNDEYGIKNLSDYGLISQRGRVTLWHEIRLPMQKQSWQLFTIMANQPNPNVLKTCFIRVFIKTFSVLPHKLPFLEFMPAQKESFISKIKQKSMNEGSASKKKFPSVKEWDNTEMCWANVFQVCLNIISAFSLVNFCLIVLIL